VFHLASGPTRRGTGGTKFFVRPLYLVRVFTDMEHDDDAVELAVQAVDRLLDVGRVNLLVDGLDMLGHHREALLELPISTTDTSSTIISRGGFYRFTARST
jgi:hypothetical protein